MKTRISIFVSVLLSLAVVACAQQSSTTSATTAVVAPAPHDTVSILFAGDAMGHSPQFQWAYDYQNGTYDYNPCFRFIRPYVADHDYSVVNLEVTLSGRPYSGYPCFSSPDELFFALRDAGFNLFSIANNHILDHGQKGTKRTIDVMGETPYMGAYLSMEDRAERYPYIADIQGLKVAFFCTTYGCNGFVAKAPHYVNLNDTTEILRDLQSLEGKDVDLKIIYIHWGDEYVLKAVPRQREMARWLADHGFDAIIGGHPHVVEDAEWIGDVPCIYSLGNYISNQRRENCNGGIMIQLDIDKQDKRVLGMSYAPVYTHKGTIDGVRQFYIIPTIEYLNGQYSFTLPEQAEKELRRHHQLVTERLSNLPLMVR